MEEQQQKTKAIKLISCELNESTKVDEQMGKNSTIQLSSVPAS